MNNIINDKGLIVGLYYSGETTTRKECLQISIKKGDKKLLSSIILRNEDFYLQYNKACIKIAEFTGCKLGDLLVTQHTFMNHYGLIVKEIKINVVSKK